MDFSIRLYIKRFNILRIQRAMKWGGSYWRTLDLLRYTMGKPQQFSVLEMSLVQKKGL